MIRKLLAVLLGLVAAAILLPAVAIALLISTETGADWLLSTLQKRELLTYHNLSGSISEGLHIEKLVVNTPNGQARIDNLALKTELKHLLYGELRLARLSASDVVIELPAAVEDKQQQAFSPPAFLNQNTPLLPFQVTLKQLSLTRLAIVMPNVEHSLRDIQLSGHMDQVGIDQLQLSLAYQQHNLRLNGFLHLWPNLRANLSLNWSVQLAGETNILGTTQITGDRRKLLIQQQTSGNVPSTLRLTVSHWLKQPQLEASGQIDVLLLPTKPSAQFSNINFELAGSPMALQGTVSGQATLDNQPEVRFDLLAGTNAEQLDVKHLQLRSDIGSAELTGWFSWAEGVKRWRSQVISQDFAANYFHPLLPERLSGNLEISGSLREQLQLLFKSTTLSGQLRGKSLQAELAGQLDGRTLNVEQFQLSVGANKINLSGNVSPQHLDTNFHIQAPDINSLVPEASGSLSIKGNLSGTPEEPTMSGHATGEQLTASGIVAEKLDAQIRLTKGLFSADRNQMTLSGLRYQSLHFDHINLTLSGEWLKPEVKVNAVTPQAQINIASSAIIGGRDINGQLREFTIENPQAGSWHLEQPTTYQFQPSAWSLDKTCLTENNGRICLMGNGSGTQLSASVQAQHLSLALLNILGTLPVQIDGKLDIDAKLERRADNIQGHGIISQAQHSTPIIISVEPNADKQISISNLKTAVNIQNRQLSGQLFANLNKEGTLKGDITLEDLRSADSPLTAHVAYDLPDLSPYAALSPDIEITAGKLTGSLSISNTLREPRIHSRSTLAIPSIYIHPLAIEWQDVTAEIITQPNQVSTILASLKAGEGRLDLNGKMHGWPPGKWSADLQVSGENALLTDQENRRVTANPNLNITVTPGNIDITGKLTIPTAKLHLQPSPGQLALTPDAIVHDERHVPTNGWATTIDVEVALQEQVFFEAYGLKTGVTGNVQISRKPRDSLLGEGELKLVGGSYRAYGQDLTIDKGIAQFGGSLSRPEVDVSATRKVADVTAGLVVTGPIDKLQTRLFSDPAMTDSEILSYIIRGKPLSDNSAADQHFLSNAALSYALGRSTPITGKLQELTGLDEVGFAAEQGVESLGLTLGKYLTPELYVRYGIGVVDKLSKLFAQYQLSEKLYLQTEIGTGQSIDLLYRTQ